MTSSFSRVTGHVNKVSPGECGANYTGLVFSPFLSFSVLVSSFFPSSFPSSLLPPPSNLPLPPPTPLRNQKLSTPIVFGGEVGCGGEVCPPRIGAQQASGCFLTANGTLSPNGTRHTVHEFARFDGRICKSDSIHSLT